jgi:hypothetical protein
MFAVVGQGESPCQKDIQTLEREEVADRNKTRERLEQSGSLEIAEKEGLIQKQPETSVGFVSQLSCIHGHCCLGPAIATYNTNYYTDPFFFISLT